MQHVKREVYSLSVFQHAGEPLDTSWQLVISKVQHAAAAARPADRSGPPWGEWMRTQTNCSRLSPDGSGHELNQICAHSSCRRGAHFHLRRKSLRRSGSLPVFLGFGLENFLSFWGGTAGWSVFVPAGGAVSSSSLTVKDKITPCVAVTHRNSLWYESRFFFYFDLKNSIFLEKEITFSMTHYYTEHQPASIVMFVCLVSELLLSKGTISSLCLHKHCSFIAVTNTTVISQDACKMALNLRWYYFYFRMPSM